MTGHDKRSKFMAEQVVQQMTDEHKLPLVIVNPSMPIGPRDINATTMVLYCGGYLTRPDALHTSIQA